MLAAAARIADPADPLGRRARAELPRTTGLSPEGVELALREHLEVGPTDRELGALARRTPVVARTHLVLASTVFVAPARAVALAVLEAPRVALRPSRREPAFPALLVAAAPDLCALVDEIDAAPGDHVHVFGADEAQRALRLAQPPGVRFHAHGPGLGVAVVEAEHFPARGRDHALGRVARALAADVVPFDQRGCLSPRMALFVGCAADAEHFARALARALAELEQRVPRGELAPAEAAEAARFRDTMTYAAQLWPAGRGAVSLATARDPLPIVPPVGRYLHVTVCGAGLEPLAPLRPLVTSVGVAAGLELRARLARELPSARVVPLGTMQRPPLDGHVDRRVRPETL
ncbi:MAG: proline dehydrogenase [Polyangiaceae bacterium]|nr:proline dehydrogenase [Polyangiaceae bacterium]